MSDALAEIRQAVQFHRSGYSSVKYPPQAIDWLAQLLELYDAQASRLSLVEQEKADLPEPLAAELALWRESPAEWKAEHQRRQAFKSGLIQRAEAAESRCEALEQERDELREQCANHCACEHDGRGSLVTECEEHKNIRVRCEALEQEKLKLSQAWVSRVTGTDAPDVSVMGRDAINGPALASAMRKLLPPILFAQVLGYIDPLGEFMKVLSAPTPEAP